MWLKIGFILCLISFLVGEIIRIPILPAGVKLIDISVLSVFVIWVFSLFLKKKLKELYKSPILIFIAVCTVSLIFNSVFLSADKLLISFLYLLRWMSYAALISLVLNFEKSFKKTIKNLFFSAGAIIVLLGYVQYFLYPDLRNLYYLGWDEHLYRMFSVFLDPNFAGAFFVLYFLFLVNNIFDGIKNKFLLITHYFISLTTLIAIYLTYSRSAFLMLVLGICIFLILKKKIAWVGIVLVILFSLIFLAPKSFRTEGTNLFRIASSEARVESARTAIEIFKKNPVFGVGFNAYRFAKEKVGSKTSELSHADSSTDNSFLFVLATTGVIGFLAFLNMWLSFLKENKNSALIVSSIISLLLNSMFINSLFYSFTLFWVFILLGLRENK